MAEPQKKLDDLFVDTLKDIYYAEKQILRALPKMAKSAEAEELRDAFQTHRDQTQGQVERLDQIFELLGKRSQGKTCEAIQGILEEGKEIMEEYAGSEALDAGLISSAQAVEHYEIARYGTLKRWAEQLGHDDVVELLDQTLSEEKETDEMLTRLAESANARGEGNGEAAEGKEAEGEEAETGKPERKSAASSRSTRDKPRAAARQ
jgi:ferritin-like metal-binding protein YciE